MGCFFICFQGSDYRKRCRKAKKSFSTDKAKERCAYVRSISSPSEILSVTKDVADNLIPTITENHDQVTVTNVRKKVTFDLQVTTFDFVPTQKDLADFTEDHEAGREVKGEKKDKKEEQSSEPNLTAYPTNHRYQHCESSDDEGLDEEANGSDEDEEDNFDESNAIGINGCEEEESYDSYFSLPMEGERQHFQEVSSVKPNIGSVIDKEPAVLPKTNVRDRSRYIHSVLNPVENLSHWKDVKARPTSLKYLSKENLGFETSPFNSTVPTLAKSQTPHMPVSSMSNPEDFGKQEVALDVSLSNWLLSSINSKLERQKSNSVMSNSSISHEDRPILGALTMEDIKHSPRTSSPRKSPSRSPDEIPIVGTVGGYWSSKSKDDSGSSWSSCSERRGIPNTTNKYGEDKIVNWHCAPFETRLEEALNKEGVL